ncbi:MAG: LptF/LptG family permease [Gemmatimonadota bacterium]
MRTLDRYIAREFMRLFLLFSLAAPILFVLGHWTDNLDTYSEKAIPLGAVALGYVYMLPQFILWSFPIASLIATVFTVGAMTRHSEMAAAKAGGISFYRATLILPTMGLILAVAGAGLTEVVPLGIRRAAELHGEKRGFRNVRNDFVYRGEDGNVYGIRRIDVASGRISSLTMENEGDGETTPTLHTFAREAVWDSTTRRWTLHDGRFRVFAPDQPERLFNFDQMIPTKLRETPEELLAEPKDPEEMRYAEINRFIQSRERSGGEPFKLMFSRSEKFAIPAATLIVILFGAPLLSGATARSGPAYGIGVSLGITIVYLMMFRLAQAVGATGAIQPDLAAWIPNMIFAAGAIVLNFRVKT